jgi:Tat protein translocase TatB subunit
MFGPLGVPELILIFVLALLLFGPRRLPEIGRTVGRALAELRRASNDFKRTIEDEVAADEVREVHRDLREAKSEIERVEPEAPKAEGEGAGPQEDS